MRRLILVAIVSAAIGGSPVIGASVRPRTVQSLGSAVDSHRVRVVIVGTGASSGDSVMVVVTKTSTAPAGTLVLTVAPGTMLHSAVRGYQNMVVAGVQGRYLGGRRYSPSSRIVVAGSGPVTYLLSAYCINPEKKNATPTIRFAFAEANPVLGCIATRGRSLTVPVMQTAVWRHTAGLSFAEVKERLGVDELDWDNALSVVQTCGRRQ